MVDLTETLVRCGEAQADYLVDAYLVENRCHAETVIGAAGALLGAALQSRGYRMAGRGQGDVMEWRQQTTPPFNKFVNCLGSLRVFVEKEWPVVVDIGTRLGAFEAADAPDLIEIIGRMPGQLSTGPFPQLSAPKEHWPLGWSPNAVPIHGDVMRAVARAQGLDADQDPLARAIALMALVHLSKGALAPRIGLSIGLEMAIATAHIGNLDQPYDVAA